MDELAKRFPRGIAYAMHYDTTRFVSASMHDVVVTLGEALILVILVVFVFLQNWRTTLIPVIAIPVSLVATLVVMKLLGFLPQTCSACWAWFWRSVWWSTTPSSWSRTWNASWKPD